MFARRHWMIVSALLVSNILGADFVAGQHKFGTRQFYGGWQKHQQHGYHFRPYFYKPTPSFNGFKHHFVIHHKSRPEHLFFFNPYKKQFWGRCSVSREDGVGKYSLLPPSLRKSVLKDIKESDFPEPSEVPPIPESTDGEPLDLPPDDLPDDSDLPGKD